ncbi:hypothetical protein C0J52_00385, partial [Blattella germanica]
FIINSQYFLRRVPIARKKKIYLPEYHRLRAAVTWKYLVGIYQLRAGNIFLPIFQRLRTLYYINSTCHGSVLELSTCQIFKILVLVSKILYQ